MSNNIANVRINIEMRSRNHFCRGKINKYYILLVCVCSFNYPASKAHASYFNAICGLSNCTLFFHITLEKRRLSRGEGGNVLNTQNERLEFL